MTRQLLLSLAVVACSNTDETKPAASTPAPVASKPAPAETKPAPAADDPWAKGTPEPDPWNAPSAGSETPAPGSEKSRPNPAPTQAPRTNSTVAGTYVCLTLRYGTAINGMYQSAYVASALGTFEIDADGAYRSASYPAKGSGRTRTDASGLVFDGGPYAGYVGQVGTTSSGAYIRFGEKLDAAPTANLRFNDHMCNRK